MSPTTLRFRRLTALLTLALLFVSAPLVAAQTPLVLESPNDSDSFGTAVARIGDLTGDGTSDVIVGAPGESTTGGFSRDGRAYLIDASDGSVLETLTASSGDGFGHSVARASAADGTPLAIVAAATRDIETDVLKTELIQLIDASDASVVQTFASPVARGDYEIASAGDIDGDGLPDVLVGSPADTVDGMAGAGRAYVLSGADASTLLTLTSPNREENGGFGTSVAGGTDVSGDGTPDLIIGAPAEDRDNDGFGFDGRAYLVDGSDGSILRTLVSPRDASEGNSTFGASIANVSDINGDGTPDLIVGASSEDVFSDGIRFVSAGRVHLISGADGTVLRTLSAPEPRSVHLGRSVAEVGDVNFDGTSDVIAGAPGPPPPAFSSTEGPVYVFSGADGTVLDTLSKPTDREDIDFGLEIAGAGDTDGDGAPDVIVGVPSGVADDLGGRAYMFSGSDLFLTATFSRTVSSSGAVNFDTTGVSINFSGVSGSGTVTVEKFSNEPRVPQGIAETNVSDYRFTIEVGGDLTVGAGTELRFDVGTLDGINTPSDVTIYTRSSAGSGSFTALSTSYDSDANDLVATTGSFSEFVFASDSNSLPVEFASFDAVQTPVGSVELTWTTASEQNNAGFRIQHRRKENWKKIGFVDGHGTTTDAQSYRYVTEDLPVGTHQFRLTQVDLDGTTTVHDPITVKVHMDRALHLRAPAPNPVRNEATLSFAVKENRETTLRLYSVLGQRIATLYRGTPIAGETETVQVNADDLASGVYLLRLRVGNRTRTERMTVVR